jgi:mono/diheme cytochrome c family protein
MIARFRSSFVFVLLAALVFCASTSQAAERQLTFEQHARPIFNTHCFHCHGEEAEKEGSLDLRLMWLAAKGGDSGPAIVPGKAADSLLIQRLEAGEMPPEGKKAVPPEQLAALRTWINQGELPARPDSLTV